MPDTTRTERTRATLQTDQLAYALRDAAIFRRALAQAYHDVAGQLTDPETVTMARRYADEDRAAADALDRTMPDLTGGTSSGATLEDEIAVALRRIVVAPGVKGAYADARILSVLVGMESAVGALDAFVLRVSERAGNAEWRPDVERRVESSRARLDYLRGRIDDLGGTAFGPDEPTHTPPSIPEG